MGALKLARLLLATSLVLAPLGCGGDDEGSGPPPEAATITFKPVQPLSREEFHAFVVASGARVPIPGSDPRADIDSDDARRLFEALCRGDRLTLFQAMLSYPSQAGAYEAVFDAAEAQCRPDAAALDRARGEAAWNMARNQLALDRLVGFDQDGVDRFCDVLDETDDITSQVLAAAAVRLGLVSETSEDLAEFAASVLIAACPHLLDFIRG